MHDLRLLFDNMYKCEDGTILSQDLIDIVIALYPDSKQSISLSRLHLIMPMNEIPLDKEVSGAIFVNFVKFCLKITVIGGSGIKESMSMSMD